MLLMAKQWLINTCTAHQETVSSNITVLDINIKPLYTQYQTFQVLQIFVEML
jgi:hypothetical protein